MSPQEIEQFKRDIDDMKQWKAEKERQQLKYPLDATSKKIIEEHLVIANGKEVVPVGLLGDITALQVEVNGNLYYILAAPTP